MFIENAHNKNTKRFGFQTSKELCGSQCLSHRRNKDSQYLVTIVTKDPQFLHSGLDKILEKIDRRQGR
jgi:hypothetical protein